MLIGSVSEEGMVLCPFGHEEVYFAGRRMLDVGEYEALEELLDDAVPEEAEVFEFECQECLEDFIVLTYEYFEL